VGPALLSVPQEDSVRHVRIQATLQLRLLVSGHAPGQVLVDDGIETHGKVGLLEHITKLADLPPDKDMLRYIREACRLLEASLSDPAPPKPAKPRKPEAEVPRDLAVALAGNRAASQAFHRFSPSHRREYIEWIAEAERDETRQKRIATALGWLAEGKPRNWKYMNC